MARCPSALTRPTRRRRSWPFRYQDAPATIDRSDCRRRPEQALRWKSPRATASQRPRCFFQRKSSRARRTRGAEDVDRGAHRRREEHARDRPAQHRVLSEPKPSRANCARCSTTTDVRTSCSDRDRRRIGVLPMRQTSHAKRDANINATKLGHTRASFPRPIPVCARIEDAIAAIAADADAGSTRRRSGPHTSGMRGKTVASIRPVRRCGRRDLGT